MDRKFDNAKSISSATTTIVIIDESKVFNVQRAELLVKVIIDGTKFFRIELK